MKFKSTVKELEAKLQHVAAIVDAKATIPVYQHVRLLVQGGKTTLTGRAPYATLEVQVTNDGPEDGAMLLPAKKLQQILPNLPDANVTLELVNDKITLRSGRYKGELVTLPADNFEGTPEVPEFDKKTLGLPGLKDLISSTIFAVPSDGDKYTVKVGLLESTGKEVRIVGTNGLHLVVASYAGIAGEFKIVWPRTAMELVQDLNGDTVTISETESAFVFQTATETLFVNKVSGEFPPYERLLPTKHATEVSVPKAVFASAIARVQPFADEEVPAIVFSLAKDGAVLALKARSNATGFADDTIEVTTAGAAQEIILNAKLLTDFVEKASGETALLIRLNDDRQPVDFVSGNNYRMLVMPIPVSAPAPAAVPATEPESSKKKK